MIIKYTVLAQNDLKELYKYLLININQQYAENVCNHIVAKLNILKKFPKLGRPFSYSIWKYRKFVIDKFYTCIYRISHESIIIIRIASVKTDQSQIVD